METINNVVALKYDAKKLLVKINAMGKKVSAIRDEIQDLGLDACRHALIGGNTYLITRMVGQLEGMNRTSFITWLMLHFPVQETEAGKSADFYNFNGKMKRIGLCSDWKEASWNFACAEAMPWWKAAKETEVKDFDLLKMLAGLPKKVDGVQEKGAKVIGLDTYKGKIALALAGEITEDQAEAIMAVLDGTAKITVTEEVDA